MFSSCRASLSKTVMGSSCASYSHVYGLSKRNGKESFEHDLSDAASTSAGSVSLSEASDTGLEFSPVSIPVMISPEKAEMWQIVESCQGHAFHARDVALAYCCLDLASVRNVSHDSVKLLLGAIELMHRCSYELQDICSVLAHACVYFSDIYTLCGSKMSQREKDHVLVSLIYLAHTYVLDVSCPLRHWHRHLFRQYCDIKTLDKAILRLMKHRKYILRVNDGDLNRRFACLQQSAEFGVMFTV